MSKPISTMSELFGVLWVVFKAHLVTILMGLYLMLMVGILAYQQGDISAQEEGRKVASKLRAEHAERLEDLREEKKELEKLNEQRLCTEACVYRNRLPATYINSFKCLCGSDHTQTLHRVPDHVVWSD